MAITEEVSWMARAAWISVSCGTLIIAVQPTLDATQHGALSTVIRSDDDENAARTQVDDLVIVDGDRIDCE